MNRSSRRFSLRSRPESPAGVLNSNRRLLAVGAIAASCVLTSILMLPAGADTMPQPVVDAQLQTFRAPAIAETPVVRDAFAVSDYTLVQWPVPASTTMSSSFGFRSCAGCSTDHKGIDLNPGNGYPIQAVADGTVVLARESDAGLGVEVVIEHVVDGQVFQSIYGHMQFGSMAVSVGQQVTRGTQVGLVGSTGASTGPHLHFGILSGGVEIDPYVWLLTYANS